jgi:hypothetical protein
MDGLTTKFALAIGAVLLIALLLLVWKFFAQVFKHVVIMLVIVVAGSAFFYFRYHSFKPPPPPYVGKHAYMKVSGEYIGVVENQAEDNRRGPVWIIRPLGGFPQKYSKARVTLKDKMELKPQQTPSPTPESKPAQEKVDKDKVYKKADKKKKN